MGKKENVFTSRIIIKRSLLCLLIVFVWIVCIKTSVHAEEKVNLNNVENDVTVIPSGKISLEISNSDALFSPAQYYFSLKPSENKLIQHNTDRKGDFNAAYEKKKYHGERKRLKGIVNLKELYLVAFRKQPEGWWLTTEGQEEIFQQITPNKQLSYIIFDDWTKSLLIDLNTGDVKHYFYDAKHLSWSKSGNLIAYAITGGPFANTVSHLEFAIFDILLNSVAWKKKIDVTSPKALAQISDIDWSPDSKYVSILTCNVLDLGIFSRMMGHPIATTEFDLLIFNLLGEFVYSKHIDGTYKGGCFARMVWDN